PEHIEVAVLRALAKNPGDRFQTVAEFRTGIEGVSSTPAASPDEPKRPSRIVPTAMDHPGRLLEEGQTIRDTYEVERFLGEGAFAEVYRVKHIFMGRQAMKVFKAADLSLELTKEILREALLLSRIGHPNIIRVFDANVLESDQGPRAFYTMEYMPEG